MANNKLLHLITLLACVGAITASECTDLCDIQYPVSDLPFTICTNQKQTAVVGYEALHSKCYFNCGISAYYYGACGCPNDCYSDLGLGTCQDGECACNAGWSGNDCSMPSCSSSKCSGHGKCIYGNDEDNKFGFDYCECDDGFTSTDCRLSMTNLETNPWGEIFGSEYGGDDKYENEHPVFNLSVMGSIYVELSEENYLYTLDPVNFENQTYVPATMFFDNGAVREKFDKVGFKIKGSSSRKNQKKPWAISINEYDEDASLRGVKKIGLKNGYESHNTDTFAKSRLYVGFSFAAGAPTYRASYVRLYVNRMFVGLYFMHEDIGKDFFRSRFDEDDGEGNFYKCHTHLPYYGDNATYYQTNGKYEQNSGNGDWADLVEFLAFVNATSDAEFYDSVEERLGVNNLLSFMIVESFLLQSDNFAKANNFGLYHRRKEGKSAQMQLIEWDFDQTLEMVDGVWAAPTNIFEFWGSRGATWPDANILPMRILASAEYNQTYAVNYRKFLTALFGSDSAQQPVDHFTQQAQFLYDSWAQDKLLQLCYGLYNASDFILYAERTRTQLLDRYLDVMAQLDAW